ncbi:SDR family oxidoreductase [Novosphingobium sp.]|uniref:SDR family NAD(P)-dependent oxidoreductase n=1 Tax=Novosphingobium sp. TaxID=1874826 RepID=UPI002B461463|nr:SDR family oxidoreductase [Novosphingobium sp.]
MELKAKRLEGRTAIVTGAAYGIGYATAERFVAEGANVVIADIKGQEEAAERLRRPNVLALQIDVRDDDSVAAGIARVLEHFGSIDILVNNAAISAELRPTRFEDQLINDWRRVYDVNVIGVFRMCRAVSPHMRRAKWGRIVNLASGTAFKGAPGMLHYIASKGAILAMTRSLATEFGDDNVLVNCVSPGLTMTESVVAADHIMENFQEFAMSSRVLKRSATAEDVANAIFFFASADSAFVTGQTVTADGGSVFH